MLQEFPLWVHVMANIENGINKTEMSKKINGTYSHVTKLFDNLRDDGYITLVKHGRIVTVKITDKGIATRKVIRELLSLLPKELSEHTYKVSFNKKETGELGVH